MAEMLILIKDQLRKLKMAPPMKSDCEEIEGILDEDNEEI